MKSEELMAQIKRLDGEIYDNETLIETLISQREQKVSDRKSARAELKAAFAKEHHIKQPSARHADIYAD